MDIATGLTTIAQAIGIVKDLRQIDKGFDVAALKLKMADLYAGLADVKIALSDARETIHERERNIRELQGKIAELTSGEACPLCDGGRMKVTSSRAHPDFGSAGAQERTLSCSKCGHTEKHYYDPDK